MKKEITRTRVSFHRKMVTASLESSRKKHVIHSIIEADITHIRSTIKQHQEQTGEKLSFTAFVTHCFAQTLKKYPEFLCFRKGRHFIYFRDITIGVMTEREINGEKVPEPYPIKKAQDLSVLDIHRILRQVQQSEGNTMGDYTGVGWVHFIPGCILLAAVRMFAKNIRMVKKYGVCAVTAVGMFSKHTSWFLPITNATVTVTVGGIRNSPSFSGVHTEPDQNHLNREKLCLTVSFDHDIIDGAPAARFVRDLTELIESGPDKA